MRYDKVRLGGMPGTLLDGSPCSLFSEQTSGFVDPDAFEPGLRPEHDLTDPSQETKCTFVSYIAVGPKFFGRKVIFVTPPEDPAVLLSPTVDLLYLRLYL